MNGQRKTRNIDISIELPPAWSGGRLHIDKETGKIQLFDTKGNLVHSQGLICNRHYQGNDKKVFLSRLVAGQKSPLMGLDVIDFLATYDLIYIVDTNELKTEDNRKHNITSFLRCVVKDIGDKYQTDLYERVGYFHFVNLKQDDPEKIGWTNLFSSDFFQEDLKMGLKIGLIVDAYLDELEDYNNRRTPVMNDHFLPDGVTLMYAKADKNDTFVNSLIKTTGTLANKYKKKFLAGEIQFPVQKSPLFECEQYWFLNEKMEEPLLSQNITGKGGLIYGDSAHIVVEMYDDDSKLIKRESVPF